MKLWYILRRIVLFGFLICLLTLSQPDLSTTEEQARRFTRSYEFDYISWTADALMIKLGQSGINITQMLTEPQQHALVTRYFELTKKYQEVQSVIERIFADPNITNPTESARDELALQKQLQKGLDGLTPLAESILQEQVSQVIVDMGIAKMGDEIPPLLFHTSPLPKALIVSPRNVIQQDANISLLADLSLEQITSLENEVEDYSDVSALIVDVGGIGVYPTMVMRSSNLNWIVDTIAHEWTHNYLTLRPLGLNYDVTPELRTMNETAASIAGSEISQEVLQRYYPELTQTIELQTGKMAIPRETADVFDFRAEMHETRVHVDDLLSQGKIDEAEHYMEERREVFVSNGYLIRKLNQAYFAFYGAYADQPGGAAGQDPVGPAVRQLREQSNSLADFLKKISLMTSFEQLQTAIAEDN